MVSGKYSALSGAITREQSMANTSANLANVSTVGYKKNRMSFESMLRGEKQINDAKGINYNRVSGNYVDFSQGPIKETGNAFDFAITGEGFFKIRGTDGDLLTRKGNFLLNQEGRLLTDTGNPVLDVGNGEITIQEATTNSIVMDNTGRLYAVSPTGDRAEIAQLAIVDIEDKSELINSSDTAYSVPQGTQEIAAQNFTITQGSLEVSNVNMTDEMARMINDNRIFATYHKVLESYSKIGEKLSELGTIA